MLHCSTIRSLERRPLLLSAAGVCGSGRPACGLFPVFSDDKILRHLALELAEILLDFLHLCVGVARGDDALGADDALLPIVQTEEQDRQLSFQRYVVETALPLGDGFACTFGGDAKTKVLALQRRTGQLVGETHVSFALHGDSTHSPEQGTQWPEEPFLLHHEFTTEALGTAVELTHLAAGGWKNVCFCRIHYY